jgi:predicted membrane protein
MADNTSFSVRSVLNDTRRKINLDDFQRGSATIVLGSAYLDLREAKIKGTEAVLELTNVLSSTYIYPAADWGVVLDITESAGSVKDKRENIPAKPKKTLRVTGITTLGSVYIR